MSAEARRVVWFLFCAGAALLSAHVSIICTHLDRIAVAVERMAPVDGGTR